MVTFKMTPEQIGPVYAASDSAHPKKIYGEDEQQIDKVSGKPLWSASFAIAGDGDMQFINVTIPADVDPVEAAKIEQMKLVHLENVTLSVGRLGKEGGQFYSFRADAVKPAVK